MENTINPVLDYKEKMGYTWFQISQETSIHPQTLAWLASRTPKDLREKTSLSLYLRLKKGTGIDLLQHVEDADKE